MRAGSPGCRWQVHGAARPDPRPLLPEDDAVGSRCCRMSALSDEWLLNARCRTTADERRRCRVVPGGQGATREGPTGREEPTGRQGPTGRRGPGAGAGRPRPAVDARHRHPGGAGRAGGPAQRAGPHVAAADRPARRSGRDRAGGRAADPRLRRGVDQRRAEPPARHLRGRLRRAPARRRRAAERDRAGAVPGRGLPPGDGARFGHGRRAAVGRCSRVGRWPLARRACCPSSCTSRATTWAP